MHQVGIFLFDDIELLDFAGPYEVFSVASELYDHGLFHVFTVSQGGQAVRTVNGLQALPDYGFGQHPGIDVLVIPGGNGTKKEMTKEPVIHWIKEAHRTAKITMSVCSGARLLGQAGLLDGLECTTHHEVVEHLSQIAPKAVIRKARYTDNGRLCTSAGISAGIDLSLHIVERLCGGEAAARTKAYMEYGDWDGA